MPWNILGKSFWPSPTFALLWAPSTTLPRPIWIFPFNLNYRLSIYHFYPLFSHFIPMRIMQEGIWRKTLLQFECKVFFVFLMATRTRMDRWVQLQCERKKQEESFVTFLGVLLHDSWCNSCVSIRIPVKIEYSCMVLKFECILLLKCDDMQKYALRQKLNSSWRPGYGKFIKRCPSIISVFM